MDIVNNHCGIGDAVNAVNNQIPAPNPSNGAHDLGSYER